MTVEVDVKAVPTGPLRENCYIVRAASGGSGCMVVDPGADAAKILKALDGTPVDIILCTHFHWDHVGAVQELVEATGAPFYIGEKDAPHLDDYETMGFGRFTNTYPDIPAPDRALADGEEFTVGDMTFGVIHTPGHTPGGIVVHGHGVAFTGDTVFKGTVGRTDFALGDPEAMQHSLVRIGTELAPETVIYPGHMGKSTVEVELETNEPLMYALENAH